MKRVLGPASQSVQKRSWQKRCSNSMTFGSLIGSVSSGCSMLARPMRTQSSRLSERGRSSARKAMIGMRWYSMRR